MAANLSRNGPALQEAYLRVVNEKSPTNWWAQRRAGGGPGRGNPGVRSRAAAGGQEIACAPHLRRPQEGRSSCLSPLAPPRVNPRPLPISPAAGLGLRASVLDPGPGCSRFRQVLLLCPETSPPSLRKRKPRRVPCKRCGQGCASRAVWQPCWHRQPGSSGVKQGGRRYGFLGLWEHGFQNLLAVPEPWGDGETTATAILFPPRPHGVHFLAGGAL